MQVRACGRMMVRIAWKRDMRPKRQGSAHLPSPYRSEAASDRFCDVGSQMDPEGEDGREDRS